MTMLMPGSAPNRLRVKSDNRCSTAAPSTGPHNVPMPPTMAPTSASTEVAGPGRAVGDAGVDVLEHLQVERTGRAHEGRREADGRELDAQRVHAAGARGVLVGAHGLQASPG